MSTPTLELPPEVARLINPAYCAGLIARTAVRYAGEQEETGTGEPYGLPYLLSFLVLPLVLHGSSRDEILKHNAKYSLHRLVRESPIVLPGLDRRVEVFKGYTRTGLLFGATHGCLSVDPLTLRVTGQERFTARLTGPQGLHATAARAVRAADRLGAWFARADPAQVFMMLQLIP